MSAAQRSNGVPQEIAVGIPPPPGGERSVALDQQEEPRRARDLSADELRAAEPDVVDYLFRAAERREREVAVLTLDRVQVPRLDERGRAVRGADGELVLEPWKVRVRALGHEQIQEATRRARRVWQVDEHGKKVFVPDDAELASWLVYLGTVPEDRERPGGWDDQRMWGRFTAGNGPDLIGRFLTVGEKQKAADLIRKLSGIELDTDLVGEASGAAEGS